MSDDEVTGHLRAAHRALDAARKADGGPATAITTLRNQVGSMIAHRLIAAAADLPVQGEPQRGES